MCSFWYDLWRDKNELRFVEHTHTHWQHSCLTDTGWRPCPVCSMQRCSNMYSEMGNGLCRCVQNESIKCLLLFGRNCLLPLFLSSHWPYYIHRYARSRTIKSENHDNRSVESDSSQKTQQSTDGPSKTRHSTARPSDISIWGVVCSGEVNCKLPGRIQITHTPQNLSHFMTGCASYGAKGVPRTLECTKGAPWVYIYWAWVHIQEYWAEGNQNLWGCMVDGHEKNASKFNSIRHYPTRPRCETPTTSVSWGPRSCQYPRSVWTATFAIQFVFIFSFVKQKLQIR